MNINSFGYQLIAFFVGIFLFNSLQISAQKTVLPDSFQKDRTIGGLPSVCAPAPIGLVSAWSGDSNALDARSRNNGTLQGNVTYAAGKVGQAFQLGGVGGDRVLVGNPANLQLIDSTIEVWIKRSSAGVVTNSPFPGSPSGIIFAYGQGGYAFFLDQATNKLGVTQVGFSAVLTPNFTITDTNWHHVAVTRSGPAFTGGTQTTFYLDGVADVPTSYAAPFAFTTNAAIGGRGDSQTDNVFFGAIDELAIYDRALSAAQIAEIYNAGTAGKCQPLATTAPDNQVLWLAGEGDANDSAGSNNGTLQNGAMFQIGKVGQSFKFDGADDQITVPDNATQNGGTNLTVEAWINPSSLPHGGTILQKRTSGNSGGYLLESTQPSGGGASNGLQFVIMIGGVYQSLNPANILTANAWQHVAATYDGAFMRIYVNGSEVANRPQTGAIDTVAAPVVIGRNVVNNQGFPGAMDEIGLYSRALSAAEIESISNAGIAGKYKAQATVPANIAAWYPGDGNTNDLQAANNGTLQGGATYAVGKVGQAFSLNGTNAYVTAPSIPANDPTGAGAGASMEAWVYFNQRPSDAGRQFYIISKNGATANEGFDIHADADNFFKIIWRGGYYGFANVSIQAGQWYHVVSTFDPNTSNSTAGVRFYLNGTLLGVANDFTPRTASNVPLSIGRDTPADSTSYFNGLIDEAAIYNRTLTPAEIRNIYYAQSAGKYKSAQNPAVSNKAMVGDVEITFAGLTEAAAVQQIPLSGAVLPSLPAGLVSTGLFSDVSAAANFTGNADLCFKLASFNDAGDFARLRIYHLESGVWLNRTTSRNFASRTVCAQVSSLSPFALALAPPTAAAVSIGGRVVTAGKGSEGARAVRNALVSLTDSNGQTRTVLTGAFGYYRFSDVSVGQTVTVSVSGKRLEFEAPVRVLNVTQEATDIDFVASP